MACMAARAVENWKDHPVTTQALSAIMSTVRCCVLGGTGMTISTLLTSVRTDMHSSPSSAGRYRRAWPTGRIDGTTSRRSRRLLRVLGEPLEVLPYRLAADVEDA